VEYAREEWMGDALRSLASSHLLRSLKSTGHRRPKFEPTGRRCSTSHRMTTEPGRHPYVMGSGASLLEAGVADRIPLVTGTLPCHEDLEQRWRRQGLSSRSVFGSGYLTTREPFGAGRQGRFRVRR